MVQGIDTYLCDGLSEARNGGVSMTRHHAAVGIVGAGPVGLAAALRLATFGISSTVLEAEPHLRRQGSRACCIQGDVVEILDRIGVGARIADEGVHWGVGRTYVGGRELFHTVYRRSGRFPAWVNLSQFRTQQLMLERIADEPAASVLWSHRVTGGAQNGDGVTLHADTPDGPRELRFAYVLACDGIHSAMRELFDVRWTGYRYGDRFLIADIRADLPLAHERHFHYDPPFNPGRQLVMHAQPDNVWRVDWQLAPGDDIDDEQRTGRLDQRIRSVIGDRPYEVEWLSTYRFNQRVVTRMRQGRVLLAGDAAHALPPYGARGMNSGLQDVDNLAWKLHLVLSGRAGDELLDTYDTERLAAARENLRVTENTIKFMVPQSRVRRLARNTLLRLAPSVRPLRGKVDSGRMSEPFVYPPSPVIGPADAEPLAGRFAPDAPLAVAGRPTRLRTLLGREFVAVYQGTDLPTAADFGHQVAGLGTDVPLRLYLVLPDGTELDGTGDFDGLKVELATGALDGYGPAPRWCLIRPDSHIAWGGPAGDRPAAAAALVEALHTASMATATGRVRR